MTTAEYVVPTKRIVSPSDLHAFLHSEGYALLNTFIEDLSTSVEDTPITADIKTTPVTHY
jgi:Phosphotyrosyl phosphate activator (PTPA) protein